MNAEFEDPNPDVDSSGRHTRRTPPAVSSHVFALVAVLLAVACCYLVWVYGQDQATINDLQNQVQQSEDKYKELRNSSKKVTSALVTLADHAANEAELYRRQGNRKQALAGIAQARHLLSLAEDLKACSTCSHRAADRIDAKLTKLTDALQPTPEEAARLQPH